MSEITQGVLSGAIIIFMLTALFCAAREEIAMCIWCVSLCLIIAEVIF